MSGSAANGATWAAAAIVAIAVLAVAGPEGAALTSADTSFGRAVQLTDPDLSPTLVDSATPRVCFVDANGDGVYNMGDAPFVRFGANTCSGSPTGMLRLVGTNTTEAGELVRASDRDGRGGVSELVQQPNLYYVDRNGDNRFNDGDVLYLGIRGASNLRVQTSDVRLTADGTLLANRQVAAGDSDAGAALRDLGTLSTYLDFLDADGDRRYSGADRAYVNVDGVSNQNVAVGDVRLSTVGSEPPGTRVGPAEIDAVHMLRTFSNVSICIVDADTSGEWEIGEAIALVGAGSCGDALSPGAARFTRSTAGPAGSRVTVGDADVGMQLLGIPAGPRTMAYIDVDGDGRWSAADQMYLNIVDTDSLRVAAGHVRLSFGPFGEAGSIVADNQHDVGQVLRALGAPRSHIQYVETAVQDAFVARSGLYVNVDGATGEGVEILDLRLSTMADDLPFGTRVGAGSRDAVLRVESQTVAVCFIDDSGNGAYEGFEPLVVGASCPTALGSDVLRLSERGALGAGTFIQEGEPDAGVRALPVPSAAQLKFFDVNGNGVWDVGDVLYADLLAPSSSVVSIGDLRLTPYGGLMSGVHVRSGDSDAGVGLSLLGPLSAYLRFVETESIGAFGHGDLLYVNVDQGGAETVEAGDVRLTDLGTPEQAPAPPDDNGPIPPSPASDNETPPPPPDGPDGNGTDGNDGGTPPDDDTTGNDDNDTSPSGPRSRTPGPGFALLTMALVGILSLLRRRP